MSLINAFEIITLAGIGLSLLSIAAFEISDARVDSRRFAKRQLAAAQPSRPAINVKTEVAANQSVELSKAA